MVDLCEVWEDERQFVTCLGSEELMGGYHCIGQTHIS